MTEAPDGYWCQNCGDVDQADVNLARHERDNYVWFDKDDLPYQAEGWAGFYSNAIQLSELP
jgi:hypothetical protein